MGETSAKMGKFNIKNPQMLFFWIGTAVVFVLMIVGLWATLSYDPNLLFMVGQTKITRDDYNVLLKDYNNGSDNYSQIQKEDKLAVLQKAAEIEIVKQQAEKMGITVSEDELNKFMDETEIAKAVKGFANLKAEDQEFLRKIGNAEILKTKIEKEVSGFKEGSVAVARFDKYYESDIKKGAELLKLTEDERKYAKEKIDLYYKELKDGTKTFKQVMEALDNDSRIGRPGWKNTNTYIFSFDFNKQDYADRGKLSGSSSLWQAIQGQAKGTSTVGVFKDLKNNSKNTAVQAEKDAFFAIINVTNSKDGAITFESWLDQKIKEYKINFENAVKKV